MTASNAPILDYASPQAKSKFRIGSRSVLRMQFSAEEFCVVETLENHAQAIGAIVFSWFAMTPMVCLAWVETLRWRDPVLAGLAWIMPLAGAATTYGVIQGTWGRTILAIGRSAITLRFVSPLRKMRDHGWPTAALRSALAVRVSRGGREVFDELQLDFGSGGVHLFTGHTLRELTEIAQAITATVNSFAPDAALGDAGDSA